MNLLYTMKRNTLSALTCEQKLKNVHGSFQLTDLSSGCGFPFGSLFSNIMCWLWVIHLNYASNNTLQDN